MRLIPLLLSLILMFAPPALAETARIAQTAGIAIGGSDPVAYVTEGRAVAGDPVLALKWRGAVWLFSSEANMMAFEMNPDAYVPLFGGYCPVALSDGEMRPGDPHNFAQVAGGVVLLSSPAARSAFDAAPKALLEAADAHWHGQ